MAWNFVITIKANAAAGRHDAFCNVTGSLGGCAAETPSRLAPGDDAPANATPANATPTNATPTNATLTATADSAAVAIPPCPRQLLRLLDEIVLNTFVSHQCDDFNCPVSEYLPKIRRLRVCLTQHSYGADYDEARLTALRRKKRDPASYQAATFARTESDTLTDFCARDVPPLVVRFTASRGCSNCECDDYHCRELSHELYDKAEPLRDLAELTFVRTSLD